MVSCWVMRTVTSLCLPTCYYTEQENIFKVIFACVHIAVVSPLEQRKKKFHIFPDISQLLLLYTVLLHLEWTESNGSLMDTFITAERGQFFSHLLPGQRLPFLSW